MAGNDPKNRRTTRSVAISSKLIPRITRGIEPGVLASKKRRPGPRLTRVVPVNQVNTGFHGGNAPALALLHSSLVGKGLCRRHSFRGLHARCGTFQTENPNSCERRLQAGLSDSSKADRQYYMLRLKSFPLMKL